MLPGTGGPAVNKTEKHPHPLDLHIVVEGRDNKEISLQSLLVVSTVKKNKAA